MALSATSTAHPQRLSLRRLWHLLCAPTPGRTGYAVRMAAGCTTTVLAGEIWQVPDLAVPALVTMALWQKDRVTNAVAGLAVNVLIVILLAFVWLLVRLTLDNPLGLVVTIAGLSFGFFFLGSASKLRPVAYMLGLIVVYALVAIDQVPVGEIITRALLYTDLFLAVPGAVMIVLGLLICPSPRTVALQGIAARLRMSAALLRGSADDALREQATDLLRAGTGELHKNIGMAKLEFMWPAAELAALGHAADASAALLALARAAAAHHAPDTLLTALDRTAAACEQGYCPVPEPRPAVAQDGSSFAVMADMLHGLPTPAPTAAPAPPEKKSGFFAPDAFTNPDHTRFAVKGTAAVMASYVLFRLLDWQEIHTCIITCFIVALPTMGEMISKLTLRIAGALTGGTIGILAIIFVMPHLHDITGFLVLVFCVSLLGAWVKTGDSRIAYAGFQIGIAFYLTDLKDYGPTTDMQTARDRIIGIMIGNFLTYAVFTSFWPQSASRNISSRMKAVAQTLGQQAEAPDTATAESRSAAVQTALSAGERQVEFALAEPDHMQADMQHLMDTRAALREADAASADLLAPSTRARGLARLARIRTFAA